MESTVVPEKTLYAFWKCDLPPYFLGGEVVKIDNAGHTLIKEYDAYFCPVKILPYDIGIKINNQFREMAYVLKTKQSEELKSLKIKATELLNIK